MHQVIEDYVKAKDWRVKENSNTNYSFAGLQGHIAQDAIAKYCLDNMYKGKIAEAHKKKFFHIHDLGMGIISYCSGWSLKDFIREGFNLDARFVYSTPAEKFSYLLGQINNFIFTMSGEWAGAQALNSVDTLLAPYIKYWNLSYEEIKEGIKSLIYNLNIKTRLQMQSPFSNFSFDLVPPKDLKDEKAFIGNKELDFTYGELQKEMDAINKAFIEVMLQGDGIGKPFTFPIPTYNITKKFNWDAEISNLIFRYAGEVGAPYFNNFINSELDESDVRSMAILGTQEVIYKKENGVISKNEIRNLIKEYLKEKKNYKILMNGKFIDIIDMFEVPYEKYDKYIKFTLDNGYTQNFSWEHKCFIYRDNKIVEIESQDILETDKFIISKSSFSETNIGSFFSGKILGYYLGEGWKRTGSDKEIIFAINIKREDIVNDIKDFFEPLGCRVNIDKIEESNIFKVNVFGNTAFGFVDNYIKGDTAKTKRIKSNIFNTSVDFRKGLLQGLFETDGHRKRNILFHTTNKNLCKDLIFVANSTGDILTYRVNDKCTRYFKEDKSDLEIFTSYELKFSSDKEIIEYNDSKYELISLKKIEHLSAKNINKVYNFTVDTKDHLYELPNGIITNQCCRLRLDKRQLEHNIGGLFGSGDYTGSIGVVTFNLPRMAYISKKVFFDNRFLSHPVLKPFDDLIEKIKFIKDENQENIQIGIIKVFYVIIDYFLDLAKESLVIKRREVEENYEKGMMPYTKRYLKGFSNHFNTIGVNGGQEACLNLFGYGIEDERGNKFMQDVLDHMLKKLEDFQEEYSNYYKEEGKGLLFNLEASPAEGAGSRFAIHDLRDFGNDIITANGKQLKFYTNSTQLPQDSYDDPFEVLDLQEELQKKYTSGTVLHFYLNEPIKNPEIVKNFVRKVFENYHLPYISISPNICICPIHGKLDKTYQYCPFNHTKKEIEEIIKRGGENLLIPE